MIDKLDKEIIRSNQEKRPRQSQGISLITAKSTDNAKIRSLITDHNHKARTYNRLGRELVLLVQKAIDENALRPQSDILGVIHEWLRLRSKRHESLLHGEEPRVNLLLSRMKSILYGPNGIDDLAAKISDSRSN